MSRGAFSAPSALMPVLARLWSLAYYLFVFFVRSNPEPNNFFPVENANRSVSLSDADRIDRFRGMNFLEAQPRIGWIGLKVPVSFTDLLLDLLLG